MSCNDVITNSPVFRPIDQDEPVHHLRRAIWKEGRVQVPWALLIGLFTCKMTLGEGVLSLGWMGGG